jgi:hypothetical protein
MHETTQFECFQIVDIGESPGAQRQRRTLRRNKGALQGDGTAAHRFDWSDAIYGTTGVWH